MHALNVEFDERMREYCEVETNDGKFLVQEAGQDDDHCKYFFDCGQEIVSQRD